MLKKDATKYLSFIYNLTSLKTTKYKYPLALGFSISFLYVLPILLTNLLYMDDISRSINGHGWDYDGRHLSTSLMIKITAGSRITDYFPYSTIFSAFILFVGGYLISYILGIEKNTKYKISSFILLINPFYLENISFRWDAIPMSVSIFVLIIPFLFLSYKALFIIISVIGISITMFTYQASIVIYPLMTLMILIKNYLNTDRNKNEKYYLILPIISFIIAIIIYKLISFITETNYSGRDSTIFFKDDFLALLANNVEQSWSYIKTVFSRYFKALIIASSLLALLSYIKFASSNKPLKNKILILVFAICVIILIPIITFILEKVIWAPRILVGFPFLIYLLLIFINNFSSKTTSIISLFFLFISLPLMSAYSNALKSQTDVEMYVAQRIDSTINLNNKTLTFHGYLEYSPETYIAIDKFPILKLIIRPYFDNNLHWAGLYFSKANAYTYPLSNNKFYDRNKIIENKDSMQVIDRTFYYTLRADSANVIVDFNDSNSKTMRFYR